MGFFKFNDQCTTFLGPLPNLQISILAIVFGQILPYIFYCLNNKPEIVSISETWRQRGSIGAVHSFILYVFILYICMCSQSAVFQGIMTTGCVLILMVFWVNADVGGADNLPLELSEKTRQKIRNWHLRIALLVFILLLVATSVLISFTYGWPFDANLSVNELKIRGFIFMLYILMILCILSMFIIMLSQKFAREKIEWTTTVSCLEHAYYDLFWLIYGFVTIES